jgi:uncharacterized protein with NRDE domain
MCLIALALNQHARYPLVIAANRDEFLHRPAAALDWWRAGLDPVPLLGGRDLQAGGTWMGLSAHGRLAMLTNVRDLPRHKSAAPSRGAIVPAWLLSHAPEAGFWRDIVAQHHNPFNLLAADLITGRWWWADDRTKVPRPLGRGLYGLSNAALDTPWPKVQRLKRALAEALDSATSPTALESRLFAALADRMTPPDDALPDTGVGMERERWLAPAFIRTPDARYGTRCSTVLIAERHAHGIRARVVERQFDATGHASSQQGVQLEHWPLSPGALPRVAAEPISAA